MGQRILVVLVAVLAAIGGVLALGRWRWRRAVGVPEQTLLASRRALPVTRFTASQLERLPAPVARYLRHVLPEGQPMVRIARFEQTGTFKTGSGEDSWRPFTAREVFSVLPPAFVWDARIRQAPGVTVMVWDSYVAGAGDLRADVLGLKTMMHMHGGDALAEGELYRYLAEAVWLPTAFLPASGIVWTPVSDSAALATVHDGRRSVSVEFRFNAADEITGVFVAARARAADGVTTAAPWEGRFWQYAAHGGMLIPEQGEVAWRLNGSLEPYWRGLTTSARYEFEP